MTNNIIPLIDCSSPGQLVQSLRATAQRYREDAADLRSTWQDREASAMWDVAARKLEKVAVDIERQWTRV